MSNNSYIDRGVSPTKEDVHKAIKSQNKGLFPGAFCKVSPDLAGDPSYCCVMHADGAGTKSIVAYMHWRESGDGRVFRGTAQDSIVMNLDDMLCVGATSGFVVSNTIGRNAHRVDAEALTHLIGGYQDFQTAMQPFGIAIELAGGETADLGDLVSTVIVDSTVIIRLPRENVIDCANIKPGNVIIGLASFGKANYETSYNSGIGSNGFTAARHDLLSKYYADKYPETYSSTLTPNQAYCGPYRLEDDLPGSDMSVGEALLSPTRTYLPIVKDILAAHAHSVTGLIHSSGGGQVKCKGFGHGLHYIKDNLFEAPAIFKTIQKASLTPTKDMYQVFNMGQRLEIYSEPEAADSIIGIAHSYGVEAKIIGRVEASRSAGQNHVSISDGHDTYVY